MPTAVARRGGGRAWLAVFLVSLTTLAVAACGLGGGGALSALAAYPGSASAEGWVDGTPSARPSPVLTGEPVESTAPQPSGTPATPLWSGDAAGAALPQRPSPLPRRLIIPRLEVEMPIVRSGVTGDGQMALPDRPDRIGWYRFGPRPGDRVGSAVLAGHVDSREYGIGPLAQLRKLKRGDRIVVEQAKGEQVYAVTRIQLISKRTVPLDEVFDRAGPARLRIVTCGGPYVPSRGGYLDNLVISAEPL